ncbi:glycerol-3-phosphate 1-O-acyltransferase PlsB [Aliiglaciecola sp. CAU 1673]|uniref:glycerol-3-phosphate 1-O-acyltransferase PlsB n=1 Tax=Aliiglaciecola sp. CAU 1673 TaxID=3032595 RepID=UPI0023DA674F|nr:glycerol-3-phosphate 1-O-acyltransferase PlsB [Aliiglaciecola sp. CAU 1673]MDF2179261.1 glycerol-3-phosphate 1-O-acyltransferase PlsB [Aliiglaciecola sp. CAU 1673]
MHWLHNLLLSTLSLPTRLLVKAKSIPADTQQELGIVQHKPIIYLLHTHSASDQLALQQSCKQLGLPDPLTPVRLGNEEHPACLFLEKPQGVFSSKIRSIDIAQNFIRILKIQRDIPDLDVQIVPVSVFWGRAPDKGKPSWAELLTDRASPSWLRKLIIVLFLGRDNFVSYSRAVSSQRVAKEHGTDEQIAHKLIRVARTHFYRKSQSITGPSLIDRRQLSNAIMGSAAVKQAIAEEQKSRKISQEKAREVAEGYLTEIAADYRERTIRLADRLLTRVWNKIYNGIEVRNAAKVRELAQNGHEIVYVPCHRSHMDYLLLTYVIYHEGLAVPHIAAGINLNFWPVGAIFRRGGAFFLRRSFAGNKLYTAVFREYLELLFSRGYPVKYYPEGGRSRTGRLLPPKTGMLAMTLQAMLKGIQRPISMVPVYVGYENVMELGSYVKELKGSSKEKESFWHIFSAIKKLKNFGHGYLSFGEPITLGPFLDNRVPDWRADIKLEADKKPSWLTPTVNQLANQIMVRINQAAAINGMSLCSLCLLAAENHALDEECLGQSLDHLLSLQRLAPYSELVNVPSVDGHALLKQTLALNKFHIQQDTYGRIVSLDGFGAIIQTYYRNNIQHLYAIAGILAATVIAGQGTERSQLEDTVAHFYPLLRRELSMHFSCEEAKTYTDAQIDAMKQLGLLEQRGKKLFAPQRASQQAGTLELLGQTIQQTLQRYAIVLTILEREGCLARAALEKQGKELAEHLSAVNGISAPEFYDKNLFSTFVNALKDNGWVETDDDGALKHSDKSAELKALVLSLVTPSVAQKLQQLLQ